MFVYIILFLGLIFGALNAMGAFAVNQKTTIKDSKAKLTLASSEKNVKAKQYAYPTWIIGQYNNNNKKNRFILNIKKIQAYKLNLYKYASHKRSPRKRQQ